MSGVRQSFCFAFEDKYGKGKPAESKWIAPPAGSYLSCTHNRAVSKFYTAGSKNWDEVAYGGLTGSWEWTFVMDYEYLEPLLTVFEDYSCVEDTSVQPVRYIHTFSKANNKRIPSFCIRRKILNEIAGGPSGSDEVSEIYGCVARNIRFASAAGSSQISVTMTGFFADEQMYKGSLDTTDYQEYTGDLVEFQCLFTGDPSCDTYVANVDSLNLSIGNNSDKIFSTCTPFARAYSEGQTNYSLGMSVYSNNPSVFKQRLYSGGVRNDPLHPLSKNMAPIPKLVMASYGLSMRDDGYTDVNACIEAAPQSALFSIDKCVIKSLTWQKGDGSKLMDQVSSCECRKVTLVICNDIPDIRTTDAHRLTSTPDTI